MDPTDERIQVNFEAFVSARMPGGLYDHGGPPVEVKRRSKVIENVDPEYEKLRDDMARKDGERVFYRDKFTGQCLWREPDWEVKWIERRERSSNEGRIEEWQQFFDPITSTMFEWNAAVDEYRWKAM